MLTVFVIGCRLTCKRYVYTSSKCTKQMHWAKLKRKKWASDIALENFDQFYKPLYGDRWPSIRLALLCQHKYCAFVNNYSDTEKAESVLQNAGAYNIRSQFNSRYKYVTRLLEDGNVSDIDANVEEDHSEPEYDVEESYEPVNDEVDDDVTARFASSAKYETANFNEFVPATRLKGLEDWVDESDQFSACNTKEEFTFQTIDEKPKALPWRWKIYCFKRGDVSTFPPPRYNKPDLLGYYLKDASSLLPVFALNPSPGDTILDMCAAPGGKALAILQTLNEVNLVCCDESLSRIKRLQDVLDAYVPHNDTTTRPSLLVCDGKKFGDQTGVFNKILVDVPCTTDRRSVNEKDNNIFKPTRMKERLNLPAVQTELLSAALKAVKPGGSVVYSTCSLSPLQNDGVVNMALHNMWQTSSCNFVIHNLSRCFYPFEFLFTFHKNVKYGHLVIPSLPRNFGPMYICKISKI